MHTNNSNYDIFEYDDIEDLSLFPEINHLGEFSDDQLGNAPKPGSLKNAAKPTLARVKQTNNKNKKQKLTSEPVQLQTGLALENSEQSNVTFSQANLETQKRKHGEIWKKSLGDNRNKKALTPKKFTQVTTTTPKVDFEKKNDSASVNETLSSIKSESTEEIGVSSIQKQLIKMTEQDHSNVIKKIKLRFPQGSCHELCCRLCRYYQTADLEEALTWEYNPETAEYSPQQLVAAYQPYSSVIKREMTQDQAYQVSQDKTINSYHNTSFPFTESRLIFIENQNSSFTTKELVSLDQISSARKSCIFPEFCSKITLENEHKSSDASVVYGMIYFYFSESTLSKAKNSGSHAIVFFAKINFDTSGTNSFLFIDPQAGKISNLLDEMVNFRSGSYEKIRGDVFGDNIFYSILGGFTLPLSFNWENSPQNILDSDREQNQKECEKKSKFYPDGNFGKNLFLPPKIQNWFKREISGNIVYFYKAENMYQAENIQGNFKRSPGESILIKRKGTCIEVYSEKDLLALAQRCGVSAFSVDNIEFDTNNVFESGKINTKKRKFFPNGEYGKNIFIDPKINNWRKHEEDGKNIFLYLAENEKKADNIRNNFCASPGKRIEIKLKDACLKVGSEMDLQELANRCGITSFSTVEIKNYNNDRVQESTKKPKKKIFHPDGKHGKYLFLEPRIYNWRKRIENGENIYFYLAESDGNANDIRKNLMLSGEEVIPIKKRGSSIEVTSDKNIKALARNCGIKSFTTTQIKLDEADDFQNTKTNVKQRKFQSSGKFSKDLFVDPGIHNWRKREDKGKINYFYLAENNSHAESIRDNFKRSLGEKIIIKVSGSSIEVESEKDFQALAERCGIKSISTVDIKLDEDNDFQKAKANVRKRKLCSDRQSNQTNQNSKASSISTLPFLTNKSQSTESKSTELSMES